MEAKERLIEILLETLKRCDPYEVISRGCHFDSGTLKFFGKSLKVQGKVYVVGVGKASCPMVKAMTEVLQGNYEEALAITKRGYEGKCDQIEVISAGHPLPDEGSIRASQRVLEIAEKAKEGDLFVFLVSGGGSSLLCLPPPEISLREIRELYKVLLSSGMRIQEINTIRRHVSMIKGGKLALKVLPAKCLTIAISDVVGDSPQDIASGPTVPDPTTFEDALSLISDYGISERIPKKILEYLKRGVRGEVPENPKEFPPGSLQLFVIGSSFLCQKAGEVCSEKGIFPYIISTKIEGEAKSFGIFWSELSKAVLTRKLRLRRPCCLIGSGEVTVSLSENWGMGGPNQEVALSAAIRIRGEKKISILSADTDGTDGPTDAAGGVVDGETYDKISSSGIRPEKALLEHRSYEALKASGSLVFTGPTGNNLNDLYLSLILRNDLK